MRPVNPLFIILLTALTMTACKKEAIETRMIAAKSGLVLRSAPNPDAEKILLMPYGANVEILDNSKHPETTMGTAKGRWMEVRFQEKEGFAFSGYMLPKEELFCMNSGGKMENETCRIKWIEDIKKSGYHFSPDACTAGVSLKTDGKVYYSGMNCLMNNGSPADVAVGTWTIINSNDPKNLKSYVEATIKKKAVCPGNGETIDVYIDSFRVEYRNPPFRGLRGTLIRYAVPVDRTGRVLLPAEPGC